MALNALITINEAVTEYMLGYLKTTENAFVYTKHAVDCVRDFHLYDSPNYVSSKVSVSALGIIEMPDDMLGFNGLFVAQNGEWWSFSQKDTLVNTTTTTLGVEGHDSDFGEGEAVQDPKTSDYGGVGGVNDYYYMLDWKARRIFCEGITSDTVLLKYVTSGIEVSGTTYVPIYVLPLIEDYLLWHECYWIPGLERFAAEREKKYLRTEYRIRNLINSMTYEEWHDTLLSVTSQAPQR